MSDQQVTLGYCPITDRRQLVCDSILLLKLRFLVQQHAIEIEKNVANGSHPQDFFLLPCLHPDSSVLTHLDPCQLCRFFNPHFSQKVEVVGKVVPLLSQVECRD